MKKFVVHQTKGSVGWLSDIIDRDCCPCTVSAKDNKFECLFEYGGYIFDIEAVEFDFSELARRVPEIIGGDILLYNHGLVKISRVDGDLIICALKIFEYGFGWLDIIVGGDWAEPDRKIFVSAPDWKSPNKN